MSSLRILSDISGTASRGGVCAFKVVLARSLRSMNFAWETEFLLIVKILEFMGFQGTIYFMSLILTYLSLSFLS